jgi:hypothetical protein
MQKSKEKEFLSEMELKKKEKKKKIKEKNAIFFDYISFAMFSSEFLA